MSNGIIDFVIPLHRYHYMVQTVVEAIYKFYSPKNIYIVTPTKFCDIIRRESIKWSVNIITIPEENFFVANYNLQYNDIYDMFNKVQDERSREFGWWYQQLIKLGAFSQIPNLSNPYVVWDSDLIPLIKWDIYPTSDSSTYKFAVLQEKSKSEWVLEQYKNSLFNLTKLSICDPEEGTFVPHHFIFYHEVLDGLIRHIELDTDNNWIKNIMNLSHTYYRFSEFRTVSAFMKKNFPDLLKYHEFQLFGKDGIRIREPRQFLKEMDEFLSCENMASIPYDYFVQFAKHKFENLPSYLQLEHI